MLYSVLALYLSAVYTVVGLPTIIYLRIDLHCNFVPFLGMISDLKNAILNIILFIPLGIMLPLLCGRFRNIKSTFLLGLGMTLIIEILQIFTFRTTDINDIITNATGTMLGYFIANMVIKKCQNSLR